MLRIAVDTSVLDLLDREPFLELKRLRETGKIEILSSTVLEREQEETNREENYKKRHLAQINSLDKKLEVGIFGISTWGNCCYGNEESRQVLQKIKSKFKDEKDAWIAATAITHKANYFITRNTKHFSPLTKYGVKVVEPSQNFLNEVKQKVESL